MKNDKKPLTVHVRKGMLNISIGIDTLAAAAERCPQFYDGDKDEYTLKVTDQTTFAREVARALNHEEEDGTTPVHVLLDDAFLAAVDDGCQGVECPGD